jgi:predicted ATPase/predicted negative regulator of RcsB-dependent stress response
MITPDGKVKILDFGLARSARAGGAGDQLTRDDEIAGTPGWMSPEQLRGETLDARSDFFAWGCLLYQCLAGTPAFPGESWAERDTSTLRDEPAWASLPADVPTETRALLKQCLAKERAGRPASLDEVLRWLPSSGTPAGRSASLPSHSLPAERDEFVGREADLRELGERLDRGARLLSVLGIGGSGKTRLVLHLARQRLADFPGGAWFCDLSEARGVEGIAHAVARALDVPLGKDDSIVQLGHAIAGRGRCLLVLDNFEQVARHAEETLGRWLDRASEAHFVTTTREVLGLSGEESFALAPLVASDASELFVRRASALKRGFAPTDEERTTIAELVDLLDRLPLAIEIAAARVSMMSPARLLERTSDRFRLLTSSGGRRDRQATLRATLDWSWGLLGQDEQSALAQLAVFEGGFTPESVESVLELDGLWPVDAVQALVDKSLVRRVSDERLDLLVSVQDYAAERLEALGSREVVETRHGRYFATFGSEEAIAALETHGGVARRQALHLELENLVAACRRAAVRGDGETAVAALAAAWSVLSQKGPFLAAAELGKQVLAMETLGPAERARALETVGTSWWRAGRLDEARGRIEEALAIQRQAGNRLGEGSLLGNLGVLHLLLGRPEEALQHLEEALAIHRELGNRGPEGIVLSHLGNLYWQQGSLEEALRHHQEGLAIHREVGARSYMGVALGNLAGLSLGQGRVEEAIQHYREALAIHREVGNRGSEGLSVGNLGLLHLQCGNLDEALWQLEEALAISREVGGRGNEGLFLGHLASLHEAAGRVDEALRHFREALAIHREVGNARFEGVVLGSLGSLHAKQGRLDEAREALTAGEANLRALDDATELAKLLCARGECERLAGNLPAARAQLAEAETGAAGNAAGPETELGQMIAGWGGRNRTSDLLINRGLGRDRRKLLSRQQVAHSVYSWVASRECPGSAWKVPDRTEECGWLAPIRHQGQPGVRARPAH